MGLDGRDSVQLPKNHNPDAGAEHTLPDPNGVLGRTGSLQASVREMNLVLMAVLSCLILLLWSDQSQCLLCRHGDVQHFFTIVHPKSTLLNQAPFYLSRNLRKSPTACLSLSLHELLSLSSPFTSHTHSARCIFTRASQRPYSS